VSYLRSLPANAALLRVFQAYPATARPLIELHELLMRDSSPFTVAERELMAAFVSSLNECSYCHGVHAATAESFGVPADTLTEAVTNLDTAPVDDRLKPVLAYLRKLTLAPARLTAADTDAVFAAGWDDRALHDAVLVGALFNFMNRMVDGLGIQVDEGYFAVSAKRLHQDGYAGLAALLDSSS
jgi:uncharacterized peroxidase-related enzyme